MKKLYNLDIMSLMNGLVFFAPVALLVRTQAGIGLSEFFVLQAILSATIFLFEIPTGKFTDRIGYKNALIVSQVLLFLARVLLCCAFIQKSLFLFVVEAVVEGVAMCFSSGTQSAYLYNVVPENEFVAKSAHVANCGTIGFVISTVSYAFIYYNYGIEGLLVATIITSLLGVAAAVGLPKERALARNEREKDGYKKASILGQICNMKAVIIIILLACINISFILINFFYVDKLQVCSLREELLTPIILGYSIIQLLAERILQKIDEKRYVAMFALTFVIAGVSMALFGTTSNVVLVVLVMLVLPLLVDLPSFILEAIQNNYVDELAQEEKRAEILSVLNMGVNLVEIIFLFASAFIADLGASMCFMIVGISMVVLGALSYEILRGRT